MSDLSFFCSVQKDFLSPAKRHLDKAMMLLIYTISKLTPQAAVAKMER